MSDKVGYITQGSYTCNGSKTGCERERFGGCKYHDAEIYRLQRQLEHVSKSALYDRERVDYYRETLCINDGKWTCMPSGAAATTINPEKLGAVLDELAEAKARIEELEKEAEVPAIAAVEAALGGHFFTDNQINEAWRYAEGASGHPRSHALASLAMLGIVACDLCGGRGCPDCHGNGWIEEKKGVRDEESE